MVTGEVRRLWVDDPRPAYILDRAGAPRWSEIWNGNPRFARERRGARVMLNAPGARPYIDYHRSTAERWAYTTWRCSTGEIFLTATETAEGSAGTGHIVIEPHTKAAASPNKQWGLDRWCQLVAAAPSLPWLQLGARGTQWLPGVRTVETNSFRTACGVLRGARAAVLPEGGLHHAAAAVGTPAVVLFGAMTSPANTGYGAHRNVWIDDPGALGWRCPHPACAAAWDRITPARVLAELTELLHEHR